MASQEVTDLVRALERLADRTHPYVVSTAAKILGIRPLTLHNWIAMKKVKVLAPQRGRVYGKRISRRELARLRQLIATAQLGEPLKEG